MGHAARRKAHIAAVASSQHAMLRFDVRVALWRVRGLRPGGAGVDEAMADLMERVGIWKRAIAATLAQERT